MNVSTEKFLWKCKTSHYECRHWKPIYSIDMFDCYNISLKFVNYHEPYLGYIIYTILVFFFLPEIYCTLSLFNISVC